MALEKIKLLMKNKGINQEELANISGIPKSTIGKILAGISKNPTLETMKAIANALDCSLDDFDEQKKIDESKAFAQTNKYENITALLDQLNPNGIDEAERHTKYLTTQEEYKKNITKSSKKTIKLKTAEEITSSRMAAFGGMVEDENLRQKLIDQAEKQRQENKPE